MQSFYKSIIRLRDRYCLSFINIFTIYIPIENILFIQEYIFFKYTIYYIIHNY